MSGSQQSLTGLIGPQTITARNNSMKEMIAWANEGNEGITLDNTCARSSGQLMDNVTEQRMLNAKIWDLSKERQKFKSQNAYERKMFLEKQARKSQVGQYSRMTKLEKMQMIFLITISVSHICFDLKNGRSPWVRRLSYFA